MKLSIATKIILFTIIQIIVFTVILGWYFVAQETIETRANLDRLGTTLVNNLAKDSEWLMLAKDDSGLRRLLENIREDTPDITYLEAESVDQKLKIRIEQASQDRAKEFSALIMTVPAVSLEDAAGFGVGLTANKEVIGRVVLALSLHPIAKKIEHLKSMAAVAVFAVILLAIQGIILMVKFLIIVPIRPLMEGIEQIAKGNLEHQIKVRSQDEIGELAQSFNVMIRSLTTTYVSRDYLDKIIHSIRNGLLVLSPQGTIIMVNKATIELLKYSQDELLGRPLQELLKDDVRVESFLADQDAVLIPLKDNTGKILKINFTIASMKDDKSSLSGYVCIAQDVVK